MFTNLFNLLEIMYNSGKLFSDRIFLKYKLDEKYISITFKEFIKKVEIFAAGLYDLGIRTGDKAGIISENHHKWIITDMALLLLGAIDVPRGSDSTEIEIEYILKHSDSKYCFVENPAQADKVLKIINNIKQIKYIILYSGSKSDITEKYDNSLNILTYDEIVENGKKLYDKHITGIKENAKSFKESDVVTIIYTSGTTGQPKGVMLTHKNILHNIKNLPDIIQIQPGKERWISILPVWHIFERTIEYIILATGGMMGYSKPTARYLLPDFQEYKPTCMVAVPRIYEALYQGIVNRVKNESNFKYFLFTFFIKIGYWFKYSFKVIKNLLPVFNKEPTLTAILKKIKAIFIISNFWFLNLLGDLLIYKTIRQKTGNSLRIPISGGGALPEYVDNFYCAVGIELFEGWGLTETAPVIGVRTLKTLIPKTVGPPAPGVEIMIGDENGNPLPNQHEKGIVYIRGDNVMKGYYKEPEKTKNVISNEGWFNTGDLGRMTITGELQLTGRAKDTIVLVGGENVEPMPIEDKLLEDPLIFQIIVVGQDQKVLGALIIPDEEELKTFANNQNIKYNNFEELLTSDKILDEYKKRIKNSINKKNGFKDYERITFIKLLKSQFEIGKELTHSLKMKRNVISDKYKNEINGMFKKVI